jgi:hypothetical protein
MDCFHVVEVFRGHLTAKVIHIRSGSPRGPTYSEYLEEGQRLTLRLELSDRSLEQADENERKALPWVILDGDEVEEVAEK